LKSTVYCIALLIYCSQVSILTSVEIYYNDQRVTYRQNSCSSALRYCIHADSGSALQ